MNLQCLCLVVLPLDNSCNMHELKIEVLLFGDDTLTEMQNLQIFKSNQNIDFNSHNSTKLST
jgi:hypothetical protein